MRILLVALALAFAVAVAAAGTAATSRVVRSDEWIGSYSVKKDGTLGGAVRAFGAPSSVRPAFDATCRARWAALGLTITFYNLGGQDPCGRTTGFFGAASIAARGWRTSKGLAIGDSALRVRQVFPAAERHGNRWWLVPRFTQATGRYAGLSAGMRGGKVFDFQVIFGKGGE